MVKERTPRQAKNKYKKNNFQVNQALFLEKIDQS